MTRKIPPTQLAPLREHAFRPGQSGNPGGRPSRQALLARRILDQTGDGDTLIREVLSIALAKPAKKDNDPTKAAKRWALDWLADRAWGRRPEIGAGPELPDTPDLGEDPSAVFMRGANQLPLPEKKQLAELLGKASLLGRQKKNLTPP